MFTFLREDPGADTQFAAKSTPPNYLPYHWSADLDLELGLQGIAGALLRVLLRVLLRNSCVELGVLLQEAKDGVNDLLHEGLAQEGLKSVRILF